MQYLLWIPPVLLAAALALAVWARWSVRRLPRTSCPRCWYDLSRTAIDAGFEILCPECGRTTTPAKLRRPRRRRLGTLAPLALLLLSAAATVYACRDERFIPHLPTRVILWTLQTHLSPPSDPWTGKALDELLTRRLTPGQLAALFGYAAESLCRSSDRTRQMEAVGLLSLWHAEKSPGGAREYDATQLRLPDVRHRDNVDLAAEDEDVLDAATSLVRAALNSANPTARYSAIVRSPCLRTLDRFKAAGVADLASSAEYMNVRQALIGLGDEGVAYVLGLLATDDEQRYGVTLLDLYRHVRGGGTLGEANWREIKRLCDTEPNRHRQRLLEAVLDAGGRTGQTQRAPGK